MPVKELEGSVLGEYLTSQSVTALGSSGDMSGGELEGAALGESGTKVGSSGQI